MKDLKDSMKLRVAILSTVLETPIFCPRKAGPEGGSPSDSGTLPGHVTINLSHDANTTNLSQLYTNILEDDLLAASELDGLPAWELDGLLAREIVVLTKELVPTKELVVITRELVVLAKELVVLARELVELTLLFIEKLMESRDFQGVLSERREYPKMLASIAWPSRGIHTEEWIPIRKLAIKLFARLWASTSEGDETKKTESTDSIEPFTSDKQLQKIAKAVNWFTDHLVNLEQDCVKLLINRLHKMGNQSPVFKELEEAFKGVLVYGEFSDPAVEEKRLNIFAQPSGLQSRTSV
ncbi:hypothetical protein FRC03_008429 [Tulasnella sp. 419]|nr:hypothetical protein FRC03_008429 [Tulasnella sp. 419]